MVEKLKELGIYDNTIILFNSDNAPTYTGSANTEFFKSAFPFSEGRGLAKGSVCEGGIRVPLIVSWSEKVQPNSVSDHISPCWNVMPTLDDISNSQASVPTDGISFLPGLSGHQEGQAKHDLLYWEYTGKQAVRKNNWRAIRSDAKDLAGEILLFDVIADPREFQDVNMKNLDIVKEMKKIVNYSHDPCIND